MNLPKLARGPGLTCALALSLFLLIQISRTESQNASSTQAPAATTTTTTTTTSTTTTTTTPGPTTTTGAPAATTPAAEATTQPASTTMREPSEQEIQEARKLIHEIASTLKDNPLRLIVNRPSMNTNQDFAPDSQEARAADATSQFGLEFIKSLARAQSAGVPRQNVVISPVSMQVLLSIILLGAKDQSPTQEELARVLGYDQRDEQAALLRSRKEKTTTSEEELASWRTRPHAAMHSLLESVSRAVHLTIDEQHQQQLLNSNPQLAAHLQTSAREGDLPLSGQVNFTLANLMLTNSDLVRTNANYERDLKRFYDIKLEQFSHLSSAANSSSTNATSAPVASTPKLHERVNLWVKNITQGQIVQLVEESDLEGPDLAMVLLNAAHFKGRWLHTFNSKLTQERTFYNEGQDLGATEAKFMRQNGVFGYGEFGGGPGGQFGERGSHQLTSALADETLLTEDLAPSPTTTTSAPSTSGRASPAAGAQTEKPAQVDEQQSAEAKRFELTAQLNCSALMLPFSLNDGQELSMVVLLPNKRDGLADLIGNLNGPALNEIYRSLNEQQVQVELPKFSFESSHDARATLQQMGLTRIFNAGAELDRMFAEPTGNKSALVPPVKVDKVIHKAKIAVDEMGAEAAAASAATIVLRNLIRPPNPSFVADHPFLFVIRHNKSNLPLFMGRIDRL